MKKPELTRASLILMFAVIFIHCASEGVTGYQRDSIQFSALLSLHRLASFAVQGFIFLSGVKLFVNHTSSFSYKRFLVGRVRRVVLPYALAFTLFYVYFLLTGTLEFSLGYYLTNLFTGGMVGHFYFVAIICQFYLLMPLWRLLADRVSALWVLPISLFVMLACRDNLPRIIEALTGNVFTYNARLFTTYLFYFTAGIYVGKNYDKAMRALKKLGLAISVSFMIIGAADCYVIYEIYTAKAYPRWADSLHVLYCICAISALMLVSLIVSENTQSEKTFRNIVLPIERASYNVYLIHPLVIFVIDKAMSVAGIHGISLRLLLRFPVVCAVSVTGCIILDRLSGIFAHCKGRHT